uniref:Origin recognition complex subunit 1 n=2 Tax=Lygus hesperus TaxID=30085 RepID=A0A146L7S1_LYGHE
MDHNVVKIELCDPLPSTNLDAMVYTRCHTFNTKFSSLCASFSPPFDGQFFGGCVLRVVRGGGGEHCVTLRPGSEVQFVESREPSTLAPCATHTPCYVFTKQRKTVRRHATPHHHGTLCCLYLDRQSAQIVCCVNPWIALRGGCGTATTDGVHTYVQLDNFYDTVPPECLVLDPKPDTVRCVYRYNGVHLPHGIVPHTALDPYVRPIDAVDDSVCEHNTQNTAADTTYIQLLTPEGPLPQRESEFTSILEYLRSSCNVRGGFLYVSGMPGTGKTATVARAVQTL